MLAPAVLCCIGGVLGHMKGVLSIAGSFLCSQRKAFTVVKSQILSVSVKACSCAEPHSPSLPQQPAVPGRQSCGVPAAGTSYSQTLLFSQRCPPPEPKVLPLLTLQLHCFLFYPACSSSSCCPACPGGPCCIPRGVSSKGFSRQRHPRVGDGWPVLPAH